MNMDWFRATLRLTAGGPAAAFIVLVIVIAAVTIWGGDFTPLALLFLFMIGSVMARTFITLSEDEDSGYLNEESEKNEGVDTSTDRERSA